MPAATKEEQIRADTARLHQLGYAQQLFRDMGGFSNFAISFTIISFLTGGLPLYSYGLNHGGPQQMGIGWLLVGAMVLVVAAAMAQLGSGLPTAGALYYQAAKLGNKHWGWITGWFNLIGQITITTGIVFGNAIFAAALLNALWNYPADLTTTSGKIGVIAVFAVLLAVQATINHVGVRLAARAADISVWWHIGVIGVLLVAVGLLHPLHPLSYAFTQSYDQSGFGSPLYAFLVGLLLAQWTFTGYDASAHVTEETVNPARRAPWVAAIIAFIPALAQFPVPAVYSIVVSISVIGLYVSYVIPVLLALIYPKRWTPGPWNLGRYWPIVGWVAVVWVAFISVVLMLPEFKAAYTGDII